MLLLRRLQQQSLTPGRIFLINTEKAGWEAFEQKAGKRLAPLMERCELWHITKEEFDHAATRNEGIAKSDADLVLFMTMDALPADDKLIENLADAFAEEKVAAAYARQLPRHDATQLERMTRGFNYPDASRLKSLEDLPLLGIKTYFCSDVCAMYDRKIFEELGGFEAPAIFNEDMVYVAGAMKQGYRVFYRADARVYHSHNYGGSQQFHRNFDIGVSQKMHPEVFAQVSSEKEGIRMLLGQAKKLFTGGHPLEVVSLFYLSGCKYLGYFLGKRYDKLPGALIRKCTSNREFWKQKRGK